MTAKEKRELLALPIADPPSIDVPSKVDRKRKWYDGTAHTNAVYNHRYTITQHGDIACMTLFANDGKPLFRTFQSADDLVSQYLNEDKPRQSNSTISGTDATIPTDSYNNQWHSIAEDDRLLYAMFADESPLYLSRGKDKEHNGFDFLCNYQTRLREYRTKQRHDKIRAELDSHMLEIRPLPQKVKDWVRSTVMKQSRYLFYNYRKSAKSMSAICTHCGRTVQLTKPHHMTEGRCPACHTVATCIAKGKHRKDSSISDKGEFAYLQSTKAGWCVRFFGVIVKHHVHAYKHNGGSYCYHEENRNFYRSGETYPEKCFVWENFKNTGNYCFCRGYSSGRDSDVQVYPANLDKLLRPQDHFTPYREIAAHCGAISPTRLICNAKDNRQIEYLYKLGLYRLCADMINGDLHELAAEDMKTIKANLKQLQTLNLDSNGLWLFGKIYEQHHKVDGDTLRWLLGIYRRRGEIATIISYQAPEVAQRYIEKQTAKLLAIPQKAPQCSHGYYGYRPETVAERLESIRSNVVGDWGDYIGECVELGLNLHDRDILRPRDLATAHEQTSAQMRVISNEQERKRQAKQARLEKKEITTLAKRIAKDYSYEADGLLIRPLMSRSEVKAEGEALKHCVGNYTNNYAAGDIYLFCIRHTTEQDKPYYTLELNPKTHEVKQYRGYRNDAPNGGTPDTEVTAFKNKWLREVVQQIGQKKQKRDKVLA